MKRNEKRIVWTIVTGIILILLIAAVTVKIPGRITGHFDGQSCGWAGGDNVSCEPSEYPYWRDVELTAMEWVWVTR